MGIYQLCYLKMHSGMLFLAGHTEDKEKETLLKALSDVMDAARKAMAGKSFARSPYRAPIAALAAGAAAALAYLEQGEREKMREEILTALNAAAKYLSVTPPQQRLSGHRRRPNRKPIKKPHALLCAARAVVL